MDHTLPEFCMVRLPENGKAVLVRLGEKGYFPTDWENPDPNYFNKKRGVTPAQREAMFMGSMFGWDVPAAYASTWEGRDVPEEI